MSFNGKFQAKTGKNLFKISINFVLSQIRLLLETKQKSFPKVSQTHAKSILKVSTKYPQNIVNVSQNQPNNYPKVSQAYEKKE